MLTITKINGAIHILYKGCIFMLQALCSHSAYRICKWFDSLTDRSEEANKALSAAVQLHDTLVKAWALWGDYLEALFTRDPSHMEYGVYAITCYLHASRHQNESKSRKYLAKVYMCPCLAK